MLSVTVTVFPGCLKEGVLLAMSSDSMRLALKGAADTMELRRVNGRWVAEDNNPVEFEVLLTDYRGDLNLVEEERPRVMTAGCC